MKKFLALKASAGSGKTFALTVRYITLLLLNAKPNEILTLTFTNKAANEMSERIYNTLLTLGDDEAYLNAIIKESLLSKKQILGKKNLLVKSFTNASLAIFTIDKFINNILREFCGYIGISDDFEIKEDDIEALSMKFLQSLDSKQFDALIDFSIYEKKKFNSIFDLFKNLLEKNENIEIVNIDSKLINVQKEQVLLSAYKIKEAILNCEIASNSAKKAKAKDDGKFGFTGEITEINGDLIKNLVKEGFIPVIAPIADSLEPNHPGFNINADFAASKVAAALDAQKVLFLTDTVGVLDKEGTLLTTLDKEAVEKYKEDGTIEGGMIPKVDSCIEAIHDGVNKAHIIDGRVEHSILLELFTKDGIGTQFLRRDNPNNGIDMNKLINDEI